jgi:hypothetical protein
MGTKGTIGVKIKDKDKGSLYFQFWCKGIGSDFEANNNGKLLTKGQLWRRHPSLALMQIEKIIDFVKENYIAIKRPRDKYL